MRILTNVNIDWLRWRWHALAASWLIIFGGVGLMATRGLPLGIDFSGGTLVTVRFEQPVTEDAVRNALTPLPGEKVVQRFGDSADQMMIRLPQTAETEQGFALEERATAIVSTLQKANVGKFEVLSVEVVGPVIGQDLQRKGIYATIASLFAIMCYIAFRFRLSFGIGAMVASIHDVLITLSLLMFAGYELSLNVIAAILTLVGYGVNDQIVIFDRVRENLRTNRREPIDVVVNKSVNQTLPRTVITAGATALSVLSLYLFGGEVLEPFAFAMLVGIITSTYSTVFIASAIAVLLSQGKRSTAAATPAAAAVTPRSGRKSGRAKAS
ncbi:MAG TPA: protein translocase subunit SecF [Vicinamibacterales bacterium]